MRYRLGLDLGANSLGWALIELDGDYRPVGLIDAGVRIFPDGRNPKDKTSLASERRLHRQMRRRRDRYLKRRQRLMDALIRHGFMPTEEAERKALVDLDPYQLRAEGLERRLTPHEFGRAVFHLNQRRGFSSNRKAAEADEESGAIRPAIAAVREEMAQRGLKTLGQLLYERHKEQNPVRCRPVGTGNRIEYERYISREMVAEEFDQLWSAQAAIDPERYPESVREELRDILLFQRRLRPVNPGKCLFEPDDDRAPLALPSVQAFRIYQELNNLRIIDERQRIRPLTLDERDQLAERLQRSAKVTFKGMRRTLRLSPDARFNLESDRRKDLAGNTTSIILAREKGFGDRWHALEPVQQEHIVERLLVEEDEDALLEWLQSKWGLDEAQALYVSRANLPAGYGSVGRRAARKLLNELQREVVDYSTAVERAGYGSHSRNYDGVIHERLPYYGHVLHRYVAGLGSGEPDDPEEKRLGRIPNPTVHIALNQLCKVVNALIERHGHPAQITVELARELKWSPQRNADYERTLASRQQENERIAEELIRLDQPNTAENRTRWKLWQELDPENALDRRCVFTGRQISAAMLFSAEVEIEHLFPFSRTLDDSFNNKTISLRSANRIKGNQTPYEAFAHSPVSGGVAFDWEGILERANRLPTAKQKRFAPDAMERFAENADFLARHLNDTAYLSRVAKGYLAAICPPNDIAATPGQLTAMLRGKWGLNSILSGSDRKERIDHRHHAVDAVVVALSDRGLLQRIATAAGRAREDHLDRLLGDIPEPWPHFNASVAQMIQHIAVSWKPDHGVQGGLHNDTAYGIVSGPDQKGQFEVRHRIPIDSIKKEKDLEGLPESPHKEALRAILDQNTGPNIRKAIAEYSDRTGVRRLRTYETLSLVPIDGKRGPRYKGYKGDSNYCYEIYRQPDGRWSGQLISRFEANQSPYRTFQDDLPRYRKYAFNGQPLVMRLCRNDMVRLDEGNGASLLRVVKMSLGRITLAPIAEGGNLKARNDATDDAFRYVTKSPDGFRKASARRVFIDVIGNVKDPGFQP